MLSPLAALETTCGNFSREEIRGNSSTLMTDFFADFLAICAISHLPPLTLGPGSLGPHRSDTNCPPPPPPSPRAPKVQGAKFRGGKAIY